MGEGIHAAAEFTRKPLSPLLRQPPPIVDHARLRRLAFALGEGLGGGINLVVDLPVDGVPSDGLMTTTILTR